MLGGPRPAELGAPAGIVAQPRAELQGSLPGPEEGLQKTGQGLQDSPALAALGSDGQ